MNTDKSTQTAPAKLPSPIGVGSKRVIGTLCPNCKEQVSECACMRNKCIVCGEAVGNITFTVCDECWKTVPIFA
jgi:hypothetical protein